MQAVDQVTQCRCHSQEINSQHSTLFAGVPPLVFARAAVLRGSYKTAEEAMQSTYDLHRRPGFNGVKFGEGGIMFAYNNSMSKDVDLRKLRGMFIDKAGK
jgi:hypothetical protein